MTGSVRTAKLHILAIFAPSGPDVPGVVTKSARPLGGGDEGRGRILPGDHGKTFCPITFVMSKCIDEASSQYQFDFKYPLLMGEVISMVIYH